MAWVDPPDWVEGQVVTAAQLDQYITANTSYLKGLSDGLTFSAVRVTRSAATSVATGSWTAVTFTAEGYDYGSWWSSGTNVVVPAGAIPSGYTSIALLCQARTIFDANATGYRGIRILLNGSSEAAFTNASFATDSSHVNGSAFIVVVAGDILTVERYQNSGGALDASSCQFDVARYMPVA